MEEHVNKRKLATVRKIDALDPIEGADLIEVATVEGWKLVVKKGEFKVGDPCVYFEIDSFLPDGVPAWQFLVDKSSREFEGVRGHKLRTIKLKGQVSQGLALPLRALPTVQYVLEEKLEGPNGIWASMNLTQRDAAQVIFDAIKLNGDIRAVNFSDLLGVKKFEAPLPACLQGQAAGLFPSFLRKTDQERCQNLKAQIFGYTDTVAPFSVDGMSHDVVSELISKGIIREQQGETGIEYVKVFAAQADANARYEITMKLDGSSGTFFNRIEETIVQDETRSTVTVKVGACSRNLELKVNDENKDNTFVRVLQDTHLEDALFKFYEDTGREIAVQGEIMGPAIQGNRENFKDFKFFVFDIFDIKRREYLGRVERKEVFNELKKTAAIEHAPVLHESVTLQELGLNSIEDLLKFAEGPSINHPIREGLVFKREDGQFSFKAISNLFLTKEKD